MPRYVLTGAPGTGKTSVIALLSARFATVREPARELIAEHRAETGETTLDGRPELFVERMVARCLRDFEGVSDADVVFFDRGLPDCVAYASAFGLDPTPILDLAATVRYEPVIFVARPWKEIYTTDSLRRATFKQVEAFDTHVYSAYTRLGYELVELPESDAESRAAFILGHIGYAW